MAYIELQSHVSYGLVGDRPVFLDLARDRYLALPPTIEQAFRHLRALDEPVLPGGIDRLTISNLRVGDATLDLRFERLADQVVATPRNKTGQVDIVSRR